MSEDDIRALICEQFLGGDTDFPLDAKTDLLAEGICDSLGLVTLASALQRRVPGLTVSDAQITRDNLGSIERIAAFIGRPAR